MRAVLVGAGVTGARAARQLISSEGFEHLVVVDDDRQRAADVAASLGERAQATDWRPDLLDGRDAVLIATPGNHRPVAEAALERGVHVVSVADSIDEVRALLALDAEARERDLVIAVGAGFSPGLSCVLARHAAGDFSSVDEVHVAHVGTGGPACARRHHRALAASAIDWRDGGWLRRAGGSGRELC
ncbi:MAG: Gfo/Idh/MocA family oxidoreductase, partial [Acidimicrobiales bacterium]